MKICIFLLKMKWNKFLILLTISIIFQKFCFGQISLSGEEILIALEKKHQVNFNYLPEDLQFFEVPTSILHNTSLNEALEEIQLHIPIIIDTYQKNKINIKVERINFCLHFVDAQSEINQENLKVILNENLTYTANRAGKIFVTDTTKLNQIRPLNNRLEVENINTTILPANSCQKVYVFQIDELDEIIIRDYIAKGITIENDLGIKIKPHEMASIPGLVEPDAFHSLQYIPGIFSASESLADLNIRGGTQDQNLVLWNGVRMYQTGHFFGMISALNSFSPNQIKAYKNGTSSKYNEGVSGVIDIESFSDFDKDNSTIIHANMLGTSIATSQKIKPSLKIDAAVRVSFTHEFQSPTYLQFSERIFQNTDLNLPEQGTFISSDIDFFFQDFSMNLQYQPTNKDRLKFGFLGIQNQLDFDEINVSTNESAPNLLNQDNLLSMVSWERQWNKKHRGVIQLSNSFYKLDALNTSVLSAQIIHQENEIIDTKFRYQHDVTLLEKTKLLAGLDFQETSVSNINQINLPSLLSVNRKVLQLYSLYGELQQKSYQDKLFIQFGIRANFFNSLTLKLEPRVNISYQINNLHNIFLLGERKHQSVAQVIEQQQDFFGIEQRRWSINESFNLVNSQQIEVGWHFTNRKWLLQSQVYIKKISGFNTKSQGFQNQLEFSNLFGSYEGVGWENMAQRKWKKIRFWTNFSWSQNNYTFNDFSPLPFPNHFNLTFSSSTGISYKGKTFSASLGSRFSTGRPFTSINTDNPIIDTDLAPSLQYNSPNQANLATYFQINASADYQFEFKASNLKFGFSLMNIFNRRTPLNEFYELDNTATSILTRRIISLGFTPNIFATFHF